MAMFQQYQNGITPVTGTSEAGARIGEMYSNALGSFGENIAEGIKTYSKNKQLWEATLGEAEGLLSQHATMQKMLLDDPEYAPFAAHLDPTMKSLGDIHNMSFGKALGTVAEAKANWANLGKDLSVFELIKTAKQNRAMSEYGGNPQVTNVPIGTNDIDGERWSNDLTYDQNIARAGENYDAQVARLPAGSKAVSKDDYIKNFLNRLPSAIGANNKIDPRVKAHTLDVLARARQASEAEARGEDTGALGYFDTHYAAGRDINTIDEYNNRVMGSNGVPNKVSADSVTNPSNPPSPVSAVPSPVVAVDNSVGVPVAGATADTPKPLKDEDYFYYDRENQKLTKKLAELYQRRSDQHKQWAKGLRNWGDDNLTDRDTWKRVAEPIEQAIKQNKFIMSGTVPPETSEQQWLREQRQKQQEEYVARNTIKLRSLEDVQKETDAADAVEPQVIAPAKVELGEMQEEGETKEEYYKRLRDFPVGGFKRLQTPDGSVKIQTPAPSKVYPNAVKPKPDSWYTAVKGDSFAQIAANAGVTRASLAKANNIPLNVDIKAGQKLRIPPSQEQNKAQDRPANSYLPIEAPEVPPANISQEEATGGTPPSDNAEDTSPNKFDTDSSGRMTYSGEINANIAPKKVVDDETQGEAQPEFTPVKTVPVGNYNTNVTGATKTPVDVGQREVSSVAQTLAKLTDRQREQVNIAKNNIYEHLSQVDSMEKSVSPAIDYLKGFRQDIAKGNSDRADFTALSQYQLTDPTEAHAIKVGIEAATLWMGGGNSAYKALGAGVEGVNALNTTARAEAIASKGYSLYKAKIANYASKIVKESGGKVTNVVVNDKLKAQAMKEAVAQMKGIGTAELKFLTRDMEAKILAGGMKAGFWTGIAHSILTPENDNPVPETVYDTTIKQQINSALTEVRGQRTGYTMFGGVPFADKFGQRKPMTAGEQGRILDVLDKHIGELENTKQNLQPIRKAFRDKLADPNALLEHYPRVIDGSAESDMSTLSQKQKIEQDQISQANEVLDDETKLGGSIIGGYSRVTQESNEEKKANMKAFLTKRLGYLPSNFDEMYRKQNPEDSLRFNVTPYGVLFNDGKEWKQMQTGKEGLQPHQIAANKAVQFGDLMPNGDYKPTEFIKGSGIKIGGLGSFGSPEQAGKFRTDYPKLLKGMSIIKDLQALNVAFSSISLEKRGQANADTKMLISQLRTAIIGVGNVSDYEQGILNDIVQNPTDFLQFRSSTSAKYNRLKDYIASQIVEMPQQYGLTVEMPADKKKEIDTVRSHYLKNTK